MSEEIKTRDSLKAAFSTGQKPTQSDFADVFNAFVHKDDKVDVTSTTGIYSIEETDRLLSSVIVGEGNAAQFMQSIEAISNAATAAQERADEAYTLAEHADGPESTGYAWANTAHTRCQDIENNVQQLTTSVENVIIANNEAKQRADEAYALAEHADGTESTGYAWANSAHTRCQEIENDVQQLSGEVGSALTMSGNALTMAQQTATTGQYGRVQLASNTGTSSDSGKVPVIGSNGKLNANVLPELSEKSQTWSSGGSINIGANGEWYNVYSLTISTGTSTTVNINLPDTLSAGAPHSITFELLLAGVGTMTFNFKRYNSTIHTVSETLSGSTRYRTVIAFVTTGLKYKLIEINS